MQLGLSMNHKSNPDKKLPENYKEIHDFVQRTGGSNADGRISKSFFKAPSSTKVIQKSIKGKYFWEKHTNADLSILDSNKADTLCFDTTMCDGTRHSNYNLSQSVLIEQSNINYVSFKFNLEEVKRKFVGLVFIVKYVNKEGTERLEKHQLKTTNTIKGSSLHKIQLVSQVGETSIKLSFHIPKDRGFKGSIQEFLLTSEDNTKITLSEKDNFSRSFALPGTQDLYHTGMPKIDMICGCETSYISEYLKILGFNVSHSFENHRAMDPYTELVSGNSAYLESDAPVTILSQVQVLRPLITKFERAAGGITRADGLDMVNSTIDALRWSINELLSHRNTKIWLLTHPIYHTPGMGFHDYRSGTDGWSVYEMLMDYKMKLYSLTHEFNGVYILDIDLALERQGKLPTGGVNHIRINESLGGHLEKEGAAIVAENFIHQLFITSERLKRIKCVVVDCDNTLWKGVLRDDGEDNVVINRIRLQRLWHLAQRGIPMALCSKNDPEDVKTIINILKRYGRFHEKVVATRINWKPKSENIRSLADEINIGIDTIAFFDDSPFERDQVKEACPDVSVFKETDIPIATEMPQFMAYGDLTEDSSKRVDRYKEETSRKKTQNNFGADRFEDFLHQCDMRLEARICTIDELSRSAEILQRTNQMNATLKRADLTLIKKFYNSNNHNVHIIKLADKFGSYGIIGTALTRLEKGKLIIDELALSCRAMGRRVEDALLEEIIGHGADHDAEQIKILVTKTSRNQQIFEALERVGFTEEKDSKKGDESIMVLNRKATGAKGRNFATWFTYDRGIIDEE